MHDCTTHGIVHAGFRGFRRFVARKKSRCNLIGNRLVIPHDTIPSNVVCELESSNVEDYEFLKRILTGMNSGRAFATISHESSLSKA
jgi:hypothetical protein